ncbi:MAG TPA: MFS transporter [Thermoleophilaceae bacterium]|nr:MFS transporter [Thermoleophilaceae bacterium]
MDRDSLRGLRAQPGYLKFLSAATLARVSDEMFSVGVVLLVLERTDSAGLAGAAVAAITLPSLISGPLLGAWLDLTGRRRTLMVIDQLVIACVLVALVVLVGHAPAWVIPLVVLPAGITYPLSFGGFTSMIPALVPGELLPPANAVETTSFNAALVVGPALAGTLSAVVGPEAPLIVEAGLALAALALIVRIPGLDSPPERADERTLWSVAGDGLRQILLVPQLRGVTAAAAIGLGGLGLLTVAFPLFAVDHLGVERSAAGYMWAAFAVGSTLGALSLVRIQRRFPPERIVLTGYAVFGLLMLSWPLAGSLPVFLALVSLAALVDGPALAAQFATRQRYVPPSLYGQVFTTAVGLKVGSFALGAALAGAVVTGLGSAEALVVAASLQMAAAAVGVTLMRLPGRPARDAAARRSAARRA